LLFIIAFEQKNKNKTKQNKTKQNKTTAKKYLLSLTQRRN